MHCHIKIICLFQNVSMLRENASATIVFSTMFGDAMESEEPTIRNSNLLPVNANGEVRLRSVASFMKIRKCR